MIHTIWATNATVEVDRLKFIHPRDQRLIDASAAKAVQFGNFFAADFSPGFGVEGILDQDFGGHEKVGKLFLVGQLLRDCRGVTLL